MKIVLIAIFCTALCSAKLKKGEDLEKEKAYNQHELIAVHAACKCYERSCKAIKGKPSESEVCTCFYDKKWADLLPWPCFKQEQWAERKCSACRKNGICYYSNDPKAPYDCYCVMKIKMCVGINTAEGNITDFCE